MTCTFLLQGSGELTERHLDEPGWGESSQRSGPEWAAEAAAGIDIAAQSHIPENDKGQFKVPPPSLSVTPRGIFLNHHE